MFHLKSISRRKAKIKVWIPRTVINREGRRLTFIGLRLIFREDTLHKISNELKKYGVKILTGIHSVEVGEIEGSWVFLADLTDSKINEIELRNILSKIDEVIEVYVGHKEIGNVVTPDFNYLVEIHFEPVIIFTKSTWDMILEGLAQRFGRAKDVFLYFMGFEYGKKFTTIWGGLLKYLNSNLMFMHFALESLKAFGWIKDYEIERFNVEASDITLKIKGIMIDGFLMKGFLEGIVYAISGKKIPIEEKGVEKEWVTYSS